MADLSTIHAKARAHQRDLDARAAFLTANELAARWRCHPDTVRVIPAAELPYTALGRGTKSVRRRYDPADVAAYEKRRKVGGAAGAAGSAAGAPTPGRAA